MPRRGVWSGAGRWGSRVRRLLLVGMAVSLLQGCAAYEYLYGKPSSRDVQRSDQDLLRSAEVQLQRRRYEDARKDLQKLMNQHPDSDLISLARLTTARALYQERKYDEAQAEYLRFIELYPQHERSDEAHYYLGMAYFRQSDSADRDQILTQKALEQFDLLQKQMPDSQYAPDAKERAVVSRRKLAEKELYVGTFYFHQGSYGAAVGRFRDLLARYPEAGFDDQALYYLGESLWQLEQKEEARAPFARLIQDHSQSEWADAAARRLGVTLVRTGPPKPQGPGLWARMKEGMKTGWNELSDTIKDYRIFQ